MRILPRPGYPEAYIWVTGSVAAFDINLGIYSNMLLQPILEEISESPVTLAFLTSPFLLECSYIMSIINSKYWDRVELPLRGALAGKVSAAARQHEAWQVARINVTRMPQSVDRRNLSYMAMEVTKFLFSEFHRTLDATSPQE